MSAPAAAADPAGRPAPTIEARGRRVDAGGHGPDGAAGTPGTPRAPERENRRTVIIVAAAVVLLVLAALALGRGGQSRSDLPLAPNNPEPGGARAAAQILGEHGVDVTLVRRTADVLAQDQADTTLVIVGADELSSDQLTALADTQAEVVLLGLGYASITELTSTVTVTAGGARAPRSSDCADPDAEAAGTIDTAGPGITGSGAVQTCFALGEDAGAYAVWEESGRTWRALPNGFPATNEGLALEGNAALVLRALGQHEQLLWYVPDPNDPFTLDDDASAPQTFFLPEAVVYQILVVALAVVIWRGRRLGRVVVEPLPVVVRAAETTRGRGRLYRRAGAHAHAGAALRAGTLARVGSRIGLPSAAGPDQVIDALARATGRSPGELEHLLYGPPPTDDDSLVALTQALDTMESEVHRA
ncbi:DUF4350 domain-containing protein [Occultella glacieicola]|uniref:DUF4350 domain-containing protein n=1 Tax=Occultella glacieicola TaxID=2518684 RepID=A0ABY2E7V2_9MICO|nr:DUF4350 domain-containing protein [Occultella glacieicola]TDE96099.1 DUF4350 domain-containing protein [Occultella glacieicola]